MTIAAHIRDTGQQQSFLYPCLLLLADRYPADQFIFFADKPTDIPGSPPANCKIIPVSPSIKNSLLLHYWYNFKLPGILQKLNAAVFLSESAVCSLRTLTPQCMILEDISFLQKKNLLQNGNGRYLKKFFAKFIDKTTAVLATENYIAPLLLLKYPSLQSKISFTARGLNKAYRPVYGNQKEEQLSQYTNGKEFFFCECSALTQPNIVYVLKAFSLFKKRLKSNMQLLLLLNNISAKECINDFTNYKFRHEVKFIPHESHEKTALLLASAYACIYLPQTMPAAYTGLHAMACAVPLITCGSIEAQSVYTTAALHTSTDEKMIAENIMLLYKDELLRNEYIKKGEELAASYTWPAAASLVWQSILSISRN